MAAPLLQLAALVLGGVTLRVAEVRGVPESTLGPMTEELEASIRSRTRQDRNYQLLLCWFPVAR